LKIKEKSMPGAPIGDAASNDLMPQGAIGGKR
jgi:hypothetical protein